MIYNYLIDLLGLPDLGDYQFLANFFVWFACFVLLIWFLNLIKNAFFGIAKRVF